MNNPSYPREIILYGGTGQAKVVKPIVEFYGSKVIAVIDDTPDLESPFQNVPIFCGLKSFISSYKDKTINHLGFVIAIGNPNGNIRIMLHHKLQDLGLAPVTIIHPSAFISEGVEIGLGSQIMAGSVIMPEVNIGIQNIINTNSSIDHESRLGDGCEVGPGATLCGEIIIGDNTWVCAGATVLPKLNIGNNCIIGAGSVVISDIEDDKRVVGVPANKFI